LEEASIDVKNARSLEENINARQDINWARLVITKNVKGMESNKPRSKVIVHKNDGKFFEAIKSRILRCQRKDESQRPIWIGNRWIGNCTGEFIKIPYFKSAIKVTLLEPSADNLIDFGSYLLFKYPKRVQSCKLAELNDVKFINLTILYHKLCAVINDFKIHGAQ